MHPYIGFEIARQHVDDLIRDADARRLGASVRHAAAAPRKRSWARRLLDRPAIPRQV
jgi:hypothetical protein